MCNCRLVRNYYDLIDYIQFMVDFFLGVTFDENMGQFLYGFQNQLKVLSVDRDIYYTLEMSEMSSGSDNAITDELITKYCSQLTFNTALADFPVTREDAIYAVIYGVHRGSTY